MELGTITGWAALVLGFLLGLKHATDADHVVAVSTIVSEYRNPWRGIWVGASWGLGHSTPLILLGIIILVLKETVLEQYGEVAPVLEFGVGVMLVFLGLQVLWNLKRAHAHAHAHAVEAEAHLHVHAHSGAELPSEPHPGLGWLSPGKPFFRLKSYVVGVVHGLAGSAAVMLVLLPQVDGFLTGLGYLVLFGVGTIVSMAIVTIVLGIPFAITGNFARLNRAVAGVAGISSLVFGVHLMSELALGIPLLPF